MSSLDFLYICLGIGFLILVGFISYASYHLVDTLKSVKGLADDYHYVVSDIKAVEKLLKSGLLHTLTVFLDFAGDFFRKKGGGKFER